MAPPRARGGTLVGLSPEKWLATGTTDKALCCPVKALRNRTFRARGEITISRWVLRAAAGAVLQFQIFDVFSQLFVFFGTAFDFQHETGLETLNRDRDRGRAGLGLPGFSLLKTRLAERAPFAWLRALSTSGTICRT